MNRKCRISVIIPCYNCYDIVGETLKSLEKQTYQGFEVICIDDGSADKTLELLKIWQKKGTLNIKVLTQENRGVSYTRNRGINEANGEYILFLDADDIYHGEFMQRMIEALEQSNADVSYCRLSRNLDDVRSLEIENFSFAMQTQAEAMDKLLFEMWNYGFYCYLYRKEIITKFNVQFDENTRHFEDREFNWKYLCHCEKYAWIDAALYGYRVTPNSATHKKTSLEHAQKSLNAVKRVEDYLKENNCAYLETLKSYLYQRVMWAVAKNIALSKDKAVYSWLRKEYDVKKCMKRTAKDSNKLVVIASWCYLIHPMLFYFVVRLKK